MCVQHKMDVAVVVEPRISGGHVEEFIRRSRFTRSIHIEASGFVGGDLVDMAA